MRSPPNPLRRTAGSIAFNSRARFAPCRSPLGSPALRKTCIRAVPDSRFQVLYFNLDLGTWNLELTLGRGVPLDAGQVAGRLDLAVTEGHEDFQDFAPSREWAAVLPLVPLHGAHERGLVVVVVPLAGGRVDKPA